MSEFPGRPDHPDFWLISEALIGQDAMSASGQDANEVIGRWINPEAATYAAMQRAIRAESQSLEPGTAAAAMWLDGFLTGMRVQQMKAAGR